MCKQTSLSLFIYFHNFTFLCARKLHFWINFHFPRSKQTSLCAPLDCVTWNWVAKSERELFARYYDSGDEDKDDVNDDVVSAVDNMDW